MCLRLNSENIGHMPRPTWSGAISFGLVNVPIKMFTAVRHKDVRFNQLHATDGVRIQQKRWCPQDEAEVPYEEIVKGYDLGGGRYVVIDPSELESLDPKANHAIDIEDFVDLDDVDPMYFDATYYLMPGQGGEKAYKLLVEAMTESRKIGIARMVMRTKQYLTAVRPRDGVLVLHTLNYADEVVEVEEFGERPGADVEVTDREMKVAQQLIDTLSTDFDPTAYRDEYRERVLDLIELKAAGEEVVLQPELEQPAPVVDLMAALEASLAASKKDVAAKRAVAEASPDADADVPASDVG